MKTTETISGKNLQQLNAKTLKENERIDKQISILMKIQDSKDFKTIIKKSTSLIDNAQAILKLPSASFSQKTTVLCFLNEGYYHLGQNKNSFNNLLELIKITEKHNEAADNSIIDCDYYYIMAATQLNDLNELAEAKKYLSKVSTKEKYLINYLEAEANLYKKKGKYLKAVNLYLEILKHEEGYDRVLNHHRLGYIYCELGDIENAKKYFNQALSIDPSFIHSRYLLANIELYEYNAENAESILNSQESAKSADFYQLEGDYYRIIKSDYEKAEISYKKSWKLSNESIEPAISLALCYIYQTNLAKFFEIYDSLEKKFSSHPHFKILELILYYISNKIEDAQKVIIELKNTMPYNYNVTQTEMAIYLQEKEYDKAIELSQEFLQKHPNDVSARDILGKTYLAKGELDLAYESLNKSYQIYEKRPYIKADLGNYFYHKKDYAKALKYYREELKEYPKQDKNFRLLNNIASAYYASGNYEQSLEWIDKAIELDKDNHSLHTHKGLVFYKEQKYNEARDSFNNALTLKPSSIGKIKSYIEKIENYLKEAEVGKEVEFNQNECLSIAEAEQAKFRLYKTQTELEESKERILKEKREKALEEEQKELKIWGEEYPARNDKNLYPLSWANLDIKKTKTYGWLDRTSSAINKLETSILDKAESLLRVGKFTESAKGQQGIKFLDKNKVEIKTLGSNGTGDIRIMGRRIKDKISGSSLYVFDEVVSKHSRF